MELEPTLDKSHPEMKGWLMKWANYMTGFQRRWFVLSNGALSYYRNQDEINQKCRGTIPLHSAQINAIDNCIFTVSNGGKITLHIKAENMEELQSWLTALNSAKSSIITGIESEGEEDKTTSSSSAVELFVETEGWLHKFVNFWKGYEKYWFVLSNGVLRYYHNRIEKNPNWKIISLQNAQINTIDFCDFSILSNGAEQPILFRATSAEEREAWVTALKLSQAKAMGIGDVKSEEAKKLLTCHSENPSTKKDDILFKYGSDNEASGTSQENPSKEINIVLEDLTERLENLSTCNNANNEDGIALPHALTALETNDHQALSSTTKPSSIVETEGWLYKFVNLWKGYEKYWFVLSNGVLRYYHNRIEKNPNWKIISLQNAQINTIDFCDFSILNNGSEQPILFRASSAEEREAWVTALKLSQSKAMFDVKSEGETKKIMTSKSENLFSKKEGRLPQYGYEPENKVEETTPHKNPTQEINSVLSDLTECLENLRTCNDTNNQHAIALKHALTTLETIDHTALTSCTKNISASAENFRISSDAMIKACHDYLRTAESQDHSWLKILQQERGQRQRLEEIVERLTPQSQLNNELS